MLLTGRWSLERGGLFDLDEFDESITSQLRDHLFALYQLTVRVHAR